MGPIVSSLRNKGSVTQANVPQFTDVPFLEGGDANLYNLSSRLIQLKGSMGWTLSHQD